MPVEKFQNSPTAFDLAHKVRNDPFTKLPYVILSLIVPHLSSSDFLSLTRASYHVLSATHYNGFWTLFIHQRILPWFWELQSDFGKLFPSTFNFKRVYLWLDSVTKHEFGMRGPFMGIANRRRIWNACQGLVPLYQDRVLKDTGERIDEEAEQIMLGALSLQLPAVMHPPPRAPRDTSNYWIHSWSEIDLSACTFEVSWDPEGTLCGMLIAFAGDKRQFGLGTSTQGPASVQSVDISHEDWIQEIILYIKDVDMLAKPRRPENISSALQCKPRRRVGVEGVTVRYQRHVA
jgi:hypothetical protein